MKKIFYLIIALTLLLFVSEASSQVISVPMDSLVSGTDTIFTATFNGQVDYVYVTVKDADAANTDSLYFYVKDTSGIGWSRVAGLNLLTDDRDQVIVPGAGSTQTYMIYHWGILEFKAELANTVYVAGRKTYISAIGKKE